MGDYNQNLGLFKPLTTKCKPFRFIGFDTETEGKDNNFVCGCVVNDVVQKFFTDKDSMRKFLLHNHNLEKYRVVATNLEFDVNSVFDINDVRVDRLYRNKLLCVVLNKKIKMYDSLNFVPASVERLGQMIGIPKLSHPSCFGRKPESKEEWLELEKYNINDAYISYKFMQNFQESINCLGGNAKMTIASTTMDVFRRKYLKGFHRQPERKVLLDMYKSYYGGRTEVIKRGTFENVNYYDFNSLYPSVMLENEFPDINTIHKEDKLMLEHEGFSEVTLVIPETDIPFIPFRSSKLIFPTGLVKGWYNHNELREALKYGVEINKFHRGYYFSDCIDLFNDFVKDLYKKRMSYKEENNEIMQIACKLLLNSLYGKFAQKIDIEEKIIKKENVTLNDFDKFEVIDMNNGFLKLTKGIKQKFSSFIIPVWSSYITSYARIKLFNSLPKDVIYMDTDSIITRKDLGDSKELGKLKREYKLKTITVIKPKMYSFIDNNDNEFVKIKGVGKTDLKRFNDILNSKTASIKRFAKYKESLRRNLKLNQELCFDKNINLEDDKRYWYGKKFSVLEQQNSLPLKI